MLCFHAYVVIMCADITAAICLNMPWRFVAIALTPRTFLNHKSPVGMKNLGNLCRCCWTAMRNEGDVLTSFLLCLCSCRGVAIEGACELAVDNAKDTYKALSVGSHVRTFGHFSMSSAACLVFFFVLSNIIILLWVSLIGCDVSTSIFHIQALTSRTNCASAHDV